MTSRLTRLRRRADRRVYRLFYALARLAFPTEVGPGRVDGGALRRVLVMANYFVGDLVVATPVLSFLREAAPHARVDVLVAPGSASLLDGDPRVDRVIAFDAKRTRSPLRWLALARRLRRERYDLVADFVLPHHLREGLLAAFVAGRRGARATPHRPVRYAGFFTHRGRVAGFERRYMAERLLYAARRAVAGGRGRAGAGTAAYPLRVAVAPDAAARVDAGLAALGVSAFGDPAAAPFVAFNAWASAPARTLAAGQAAAVAAGVAERHPDLVVVLTPPPGADAGAAAIVGAARARLAPDDARRVVAFPASPGLADLVALLARATAVITPDTANVHLAAALGRPTVALYTPLGGTKMVHWAPPGRRHRAVAVEGRQPLAAIPPRAVVEAFDALWAELHGGRRPRPAEYALRP